MKNLNEYPTPITDDFCAKLDHETDWEKWQLTASKCADVERKLAACREALEHAQSCNECDPVDVEIMQDKARATLAATAP